MDSNIYLVEYYIHKILLPFIYNKWYLFNVAFLAIKKGFFPMYYNCVFFLLFVNL